MSNLPESAIAANPDGRVVRFVGIRLAEGGYDLFLDLRDEVSGAHLQYHEPLTLTRDSAAR